MKRRIIFLDFDGVLNSLLFCEKLSAETTSSAWQERLAANGGSTATREMIDPAAVARLNNLVPKRFGRDPRKRTPGVLVVGARNQ